MLAGLHSHLEKNLLLSFSRLLAEFISFPSSRERLPTPGFWPGEFHGLVTKSRIRLSDFHSLPYSPLAEGSNFLLTFSCRLPSDLRSHPQLPAMWVSLTWGLTSLSQQGEFLTSGRALTWLSQSHPRWSPFWWTKNQLIWNLNYICKISFSLPYSVVVVQLLSHVWLCDPMDGSMPGSSVLYYLPEFAQIHVHWVSDAIQSSSPSSLALNLSQHQGLF